jgi:hypothetical protein
VDQKKQEKSKGGQVQKQLDFNEKENVQNQVMGNIMTQFKNCLGMRVTHDNDVITLDQDEYVECLIQRFQMSDCSTVNIPMVVNFQCVKRKGECDPELLYQQLICALMHLAVNTHPDILHAVVR